MAACIQCNLEFGCSCNLHEGKYCDKCFNKLSLEGKIIPRNENTCGQTIENLQEKLEYVLEKYKLEKLIRIQNKSIIKYQIRHISDNPCKYYDIINKM